MHRFFLTGLLLTTGFILGAALLAQPPAKTTDPKADTKGPDAKKEPKEPDTKIDKGSENRWPKLISGKKLEDWVKEMKESKDASSREFAIKTIPFFGPDCTKAASANLLHAMKEDPDLNVRLAAIAMVPRIGFDKTEINPGLDYLVGLLKPGSTATSHTKHEVIVALGACGGIAKRAIPTLVEVTLADTHSWHNRQAAAVALGQLGVPLPPPTMPGKEKEKEKEAPKEYAPDSAAVLGLVKALGDTSHVVRQAAISSLLALGPPDPGDPAYDRMRKALLIRFKDADKSVAIWSRVMYVQSETKITKDNDVHIKDLEKYIDDKEEAATRAEALQAIGVLGEAAKAHVSRLISIASRTDEEPQVVNMAIYGVSGMKSQLSKTLPVLESLTKHKDVSVKATAENAIKLLTGKAPEEPEKKEEPKKDAVLKN